MIEYIWGRGFKMAHVIHQDRHVLDLVLVGRACYVFHPNGNFRRFVSEEAAREWIAERAQ
jgi:hypothetical protein